MDILIREANAEDAQHLATFRYLMFSEMKPETDLTPVREAFIVEATAYYENAVGRQDIYSAVATAEGKVVGCGTLILKERPPSIRALKNIVGDILNIFVTPEFRHQGIAKQIMETLHAEAQHRGAKRVVLTASQFGEPLYRKLGYTVNPSFMEKDL